MPACATHNYFRFFLFSVSDILRALVLTALRPIGHKIKIVTVAHSATPGADGTNLVG